MTVPTDLATLTVSVAEGVAEVTMTGPAPGNAMGSDFFRELPVVFDALGADDEVRAVVLTGSGGQFSYGLDLRDMAPLFGPLLADATARARQDFLQGLRDLQASISAVADCRKPVVAAIDGWCIGGGVDLATAVDARVASPGAMFSVREARMAIVADLGSLQRLVGIIGDGHLRELALTGGDIDAARAERIGLVNSVHDDALAAAHELATEMAQNSPLVLGGIKDVLDAERGPRVDAGLRYVAAWNAAFLPSKDLGEALASFAERRPPRFTGE